MTKHHSVAKLLKKLLGRQAFPIKSKIKSVVFTSGLLKITSEIKFTRKIKVHIKLF